MDFKKIEDADAARGLFKMAIHDLISSSSLLEAKEALSLKHQVLCDETAIIGVSRQENNTTGESQKIEIKFGMSEFSRTKLQNKSREEQRRIRREERERVREERERVRMEERKRETDA